MLSERKNGMQVAFVQWQSGGAKRYEIVCLPLPSHSERVRNGISKKSQTNGKKRNCAMLWAPCGRSLYDALSFSIELLRRTSRILTEKTLEEVFQIGKERKNFLSK